MPGLLVIYNPTAGQRRASIFRDTIAALNCPPGGVVMQATQKRGDAEEMARTAAASGEYAVIAAAGGDGTINEVANGLKGFPQQQLAIIPLGTANVLAREIGLKPQPEAIARSILSPQPKLIYPGLVNSRRFLLMVSLGLDSFVVANLNSELKKIIGPLAYVWGGLKAGFSYKFPPINLENRSCYGVIVAKAQRYGGPFVVAPDTSLTQPDLQVIVLERPGLLANLNYSLAMLQGRLAKSQGVSSYLTDNLGIRPSHDLSYQIDGDSEEVTGPLQITVDKLPLTLLHP